MGTIGAFIGQHRIKMACTRTDRNPNMEEDEWSRSASHWKCRLRKGNRSLTTYFSMGSALKGPPSAEDVLDSLASDAAGYENSGGDFEAWAQEYGQDPDSRQAERMFKRIGKASEKLGAFLGSDVYKQLLWDTERL